VQDLYVVVCLFNLRLVARALLVNTLHLVIKMLRTISQVCLLPTQKLVLYVIPLHLQVRTELFSPPVLVP
jgi:type IV secretory pathway component VirB8